ncbi:hypothetical protein ACFSL4_32140 [Streptomyces caeni]|uniref:Tyr recombinase domain-containing protein n=1 Tax=Streptomyces caeni TaxID=2307231 RepID=A0ABW4J1C9_9ACTN
MKGDRLYALYLLALTMGLRKGEQLGLRWDAVDLEKGESPSHVRGLSPARSTTAAPPRPRPIGGR